MKIKEITEMRIIRDYTYESRIVNLSFNDILKNRLDNKSWILLLKKFLEKPYSYWNKEIVKQALAVLNNDKERTKQAILYQSENLTTAVDNILQPSASLIDDIPQSLGEMPFFQIRDDYNPTYLKIAEGVWNNIATLYWSILKKKAVEGKYEVTGAIAVFNAKGHQFIYQGFDDEVRNAIAHGKVKYNQFEILYNNKRLTPSELLLLQDKLWQTNLSLLLALIIFLSENPDTEIPSGIAFLLTIMELEREGIEIEKIADVDLWTVGKQIYVKTKTKFSAKTSLLSLALKIADLLIKYTGDESNRIAIEVDTGKMARTLIIIQTKELINAISKDKDIEDSKEVFAEPLLFWYQGNHRLDKIYMWKIIWSYYMTQLKHDLIPLFTSPMRSMYQIRFIGNASVSGISRIRLILTLNSQVKEKDINRNLIKEILVDAINQYKNKHFKPITSDIDRKVLLKKKPSYIWLSLYKNNGTLRWVRADGWVGKNLIGQAEWRANSKLQPLELRNPEETIGTLGIRYRMDQQAFAKPSEQMRDVVSQLLVEKLHKSSSVGI